MRTDSWFLLLLLPFLSLQSISLPDSSPAEQTKAVRDFIYGDEPEPARANGTTPPIAAAPTATDSAAPAEPSA